MTRRGLLLSSGLLLAGIACAGWFYFNNPLNASNRPLFANSRSADSETGRTGWHVDAITLPDGSIVEYDDEFNVLVIGIRAAPSDLLLMPGRFGNGMRASYNNTAIDLPLRRNTALIFGAKGLQKIVNLESRRAKDLYLAIQGDNSFVEKVFQDGAQP